MNKKRRYTIVFAILCMNFILMSGTLANSALAAIIRAFPNNSVSTVQMVPMIYHIGHLVATIFFAWLTYHLTRKNLGMLAVLLVGIFGVIPAFWHSSLAIILACMMLLGLGLGTIANIVPLMVTEYFEGEERAKVMGWAYGASSLGMILLTAISGFLGRNHWYNLFYVYLISFVIFVVVLMLMPKDSSRTQSSKQHVNVHQAFSGLNKNVYWLYLLTLALAIIMASFMTNLGIVLAPMGHGTAYVALVTALGNIGSLLTAIFLSQIRKITRTNTLAIGYAFFVLSFILVIIGNSFVLHALGYFCNSVGIIMVNATLPYELSIITKKVQYPVAISINTFVNALGSTFAPQLLRLLRIPAGNSQFIFGAALSAIICLFLLITRFGLHLTKVQVN